MSRLQEFQLQGQQSVFHLERLRCDLIDYPSLSRQEPRIGNRRRRQTFALQRQKSIRRHFRLERRRNWHLRINSLKQTRLCPSRGRPFCSGKVQREVTTFGNADFRADKPFSMGVQRRWSCPLQRQISREQHIPDISVGHKTALAQTHRHRPVNRGCLAGRAALRRHIECRCVACIAGIEPVCVPAGLELKSQPNPQLLIRTNGIPVRDQRCRIIGRSHRRAFCRKRRLTGSQTTYPYR